MVRNYLSAASFYHSTAVLLGLIQFLITSCSTRLLSTTPSHLPGSHLLVNTVRYIISRLPGQYPKHWFIPLKIDVV